MPAASLFILGRKANRRAWERAFQEAGSFTVGAFTTYRRETFYSDATPTPPPKTKCLYRVRVRPKVSLSKALSKP